MEHSDQQNEENKNLITKGHLKWIMIGFGLAAFFVIIAPWLFSMPSGIGGFSEGTAHVGDTIGGITAPITNLIGAILVFLALVAQVDANDQIRIQILKQEADSQQQKKVQYIKEDLTVLRRDIDDFEYIYKGIGATTAPVTYKGSQAIHKLLYWYSKRGEATHNDSDYKRNPEVAQLLTILDILISLHLKIRAEISDKIERHYLNSALGLLVSTKLAAPFILYKSERIRPGKMCFDCNKVHKPAHVILFERYDELQSILN